MDASLGTNRDFRRFWIGQTASNLGDAFGFVAMPLLVFDVTKSVVAMGTVTALIGGGQWVGATFSGVVVDRVNRRRLMLTCDLVRMVLYAILPFALKLGTHPLAIICSITALTALTSNFFAVAYMAAVPNLVSTEHVASANGRLQGTQALTFVFGSTLAGVVCSRFGASWALGIDALSFVASAFCLSRITFRTEHVARGGNGTALGDLWTGLSFLVRHRLLRTLAMFQGGVALLGSIGVVAAVIDLIVYRLKTDCAASSSEVGAVLACASIGAVFGAVGASRAQKRLGLGRVVVTGTAIQAAGMLAAGLGDGVALLTLGGTLWSGGLTFRAVGANSLRQMATPDALVGRVVAAGWVIIFAAGACGALMVTHLAAAIGAGHTATTIGASLAVLCVVASASPLARSTRLAT